MGTFLGATSVTKLNNGAFIIAADHEGIFVKQQDEWVKTLTLTKERILDLKSTGQIVYGVGDAGLFIMSKNGGETWRMKRFHTNSSMWSVCCNNEGLIVTHSEKSLFLSRNFGETWQRVEPFTFSKNPPAIRSLCLHEDYLFIGTKIHPTNGGIWRLNLKTGEIRKIRKEKGSMIASMDVNEDTLLAACGSCRGKNGKIIFSELSQVMGADSPIWKVCMSEKSEACYLDLSWSDNVLYTTSAKNKHGIGTISRVFLNEKKVVPFGEVKGHGWRIVNREEEYVVAGLYESYHYKKFLH